MIYVLIAALIAWNLSLTRRISGLEGILRTFTAADYHAARTRAGYPATEKGQQ